MTIVLPEENEEELNEEMAEISVGLYGCHKRGEDAKELEIIFVKK